MRGRGTTCTEARVASAFSAAAPSWSARKVRCEQSQEVCGSRKALGYGEELPLPPSARGPSSLCGAFVEPSGGNAGRVLRPGS